MKKLAMPIALVALVTVVAFLGILNSRRAAAIQSWQSNASTQGAQIDAGKIEIATLQAEERSLIGTQSILATKLARKTEQVIETVIVPVTVTPTPSPEFTATITPIPSLTLRPTSTKSPLEQDKRPGIYLVGIDIAAGLWRSEATGSSECYWKVSTRTGDTMRNFFGPAGGTMYIPTSGFQVEMDPECGTWTYMGP